MKKISLLFVLLILSSTDLIAQEFLTNLEWIYRINIIEAYIADPYTSGSLNIVDEIEAEVKYQLRIADLKVEYSEGKRGSFTGSVTLYKVGTNTFFFVGDLSFIQFITDSGGNSQIVIVWQDLIRGSSSSKYSGKQKILEEYKKASKEFVKVYFKYN